MTYTFTTRDRLVTLPVIAMMVLTVCRSASGPLRAGETELPRPAETIGLTKQLFVDDFLISRMTNIARELGVVTKANGGQPVSFWRIGPDGRRYVLPVWQLFHTVYYDPGRQLFRMWCRGVPSETAYKSDGTVDWDQVRYLYCESNDGLNFFLRSELQGLYSRGDYNLVVTFDATEDDAGHRYRIGYDGGRPEFPNGACLAHSKDGITWTPYNDGKPVTGRAADFSNQVFWDPDVKLYRLFTRTDFGAAGGVDERRGVRMMTNPDLKRNPANWTTIHEWTFDREGPEEWRRRQPYMLTDWVYHGVHFALMSVYEWPVDYSEGTETDQFHRHERDINNFYIMTSRDAVRWDQSWVYAGKPLVPRGGDGAWDKDLLFPSSRIITYDDRHFIYYGGCNERHGTPGVCLPRRVPGIGLAFLRLDGFVGLKAGAEPGTIVTKPFRLEGRSVQFNVDARQGEFKVGLLNPEGQPIAGYSLADAVGYRGVDDVRLLPRWRGNASLEKLRGRDLRLEIQLQNSTIYSFQVQ